MRSAIALAPSQGEPGGLLIASEIYDMELQAELVVLSAGRQGSNHRRSCKSL
ncbi:MAG: CHAT domain-containing protein [Okeania sp. SIO2D1]|nr:CHAT domain-containing protein [Okeania sp. SIO2D1]